MHHSSIRDHLMKIHPDKPHTTLEPGYVYNSQSVPEPDEFNSRDFDREKFIESQQTSPLSKPKRICSETQLSYPLLPLWPFYFYYPTPIIPTSPPKSFDIDQILDLSMPKNKRKRLSTDDETN